MAVTEWTIEDPTQSDKGYLLTDTSDILTTNVWDRIVFSNWDFYSQNTVWQIDNTF